MLKERKSDSSTDIVKIGTAVLTQKAQIVDDVTSADTQTLIQEMFDIMKKENGVGLAAPQINIPQQIAVIEAEGQRLVLINPKIISRSDEMIVFKEGCLSVPGEELDIFRHQKIMVQYIDENGRSAKLKATDFLSIVCQHEIDHLNGILITDRYARQEHLRKTFNIPQKNL